MNITGGRFLVTVPDHDLWPFQLDYTRPPNSPSLLRGGWPLSLDDLDGLIALGAALAERRDALQERKRGDMTP